MTSEQLNQTVTELYRPNSYSSQGGYVPSTDYASVEVVYQDQESVKSYYERLGDPLSAEALADFSEAGYVYKIARVPGPLDFAPSVHVYESADEALSAGIARLERQGYLRVSKDEAERLSREDADSRLSAKRGRQELRRVLSAALASRTLEQLANELGVQPQHRGGLAKFISGKKPVISGEELYRVAEAAERLPASG